MTCVLGFNQYSLNLIGRDERGRFIKYNTNTTQQQSFSLISSRTLQSLKNDLGFISSRMYLRRELAEETMDEEFTVDGVAYSGIRFVLLSLSHGMQSAIFSRSLA